MAKRGDGTSKGWFHGTGRGESKNGQQHTWLLPYIPAGNLSPGPKNLRFPKPVSTELFESFGSFPYIPLHRNKQSQKTHPPSPHATRLDHHLQISSTLRLSISQPFSRIFHGARQVIILIG